MNNINWLDVYNSFTFFMVLAAIAFGILLVAIKMDSPRSKKR